MARLLHVFNVLGRSALRVAVSRPTVTRFPGFFPGFGFALVCGVLVAGRAAAQDESTGDGAQAEAASAQSASTGAADAAADDVLAGHSYHGDVFNEGPRQKAYLMGGTGNVHLEITSDVPEVQAFFDQGLGQLYGFWYLEAERSFRHAASLDPECAMCYWGAAMANLGNAKRAKGFIEEAVERKDAASARERMYIEALSDYINADKGKKDERDQAYTKALENIILEHPEDIEARGLLIGHLYASRSADTSYFAVNALIEELFDVNPMHPAHHFRIHLWDYRKPEMALSSAARCGQAAPAIAHMWHMPGHIYSRLKRYSDAAWQQEASARVDHAHMMRDRVMPDEIHNFAHNNEWLIRNLIHVGRVHDAVDLARNMIELPRHPRYNTLERRGSSRYGRQRLFQVLRTYELWDKVVALAATPYLEPTDVEREQTKRLRYLGVAYFRLGDLENGRGQLAELESRLQKVQAEQEQAVTVARDKARKQQDAAEHETAEPEKAEVAAEKSGDEQDTAGQGKEPDGDKAKEKAEEAIEKAAAEARKPFAPRIRDLEGHIAALQGHEALATGEFPKAYELLKKAADVDSTHLAQVRWLAGEREAAEKDLREFVAKHENEVQPLALLVDMLWRSGNRKDAEQVFGELRTLSSDIDVDNPVFERLQPLAGELGLPGDWRVPREPSTDVGERPPLADLGPFRWQPSPAPDWSLPDADGNPHSSSEYQGRPYVLIFYLGAGCLHCAEQLQAFAPRYADFQAAGLDMVAISTDDEVGLKLSLDNYAESAQALGTSETLSIPLRSDSKLKVFRKYRCYDDFENQPLHGTFVIDRDGAVLWQDIGYEPFMEPEFVIQEARRLIQQRRSSETREVATRDRES